MRILFPTAFSMHAKHYFQYAIEMTRRFNGELIMMHTFLKSESRVATSMDLQQRGKMVIKELKEFVEKNLPEHFNIKISYLVKEKGPVQSILDAGKEKDIGLIVMGMKAKPAQGPAYIGSVAKEIMQKAECPVMVIPPSAKFTLIDRLVYAMDFQFRDLAAINDMQDWCKTMKAELTCVHVWEKGEKQKIIERNIGILAELYGEKEPKINMEVIKGDVIDEIIKYTKENEVDLLILGSHNRKFFERLFLTSTTMEIAKMADTPILVLKYE